MDVSGQFEDSQLLMEKLSLLVTETERRSLQDEEFFSSNMNLFIKSFMVLMCAYLESYLKSSVKSYLEKIEQSLEKIAYPKNLLRWSVQKEKYKHSNDGIKDKFNLGITDDDIDKNLSANPYKTIPFFGRLGIELHTDDNFMQLSERVETVVNKRNNIVHYNDEAGDIGARDIIQYINLLLEYMKIIDIRIQENIICLPSS